MTTAIEVLTKLFTDRVLAGDFTGAWSLNELTALVTGSTYVSDKKKWITYRALCVVRRDIKNTYGHCIYKVNGKGFVILNEHKDFVQVFNRGMDFVKGITQTLLIPVANGGKLIQLNDQQVRTGITEAQELLKALSIIRDTKQLTPST